MNIAMICIDCLRNDFIEKDYADTPFLNKIRNQGLYFSNMHSTTTTTTPSVASFMTGQYSENNEVNSLEEAKLSKDSTTLAEKLSSEGLNTYGWVTGPLVEKTGLDRGFDEYKCRDEDKTLFSDWENSLNQKIESLEEPFFLYLHLWELHEPINVPKEFDKEKYGERPYSKALSALDRKLEKIYEKLPKDTVLVINGDHGESITWRDNKIQKWVKRARTVLRYHLGLNTRPIERKINQLTDNRSKIKDHFIEEGHGETAFDFTTNVPFIINSSELESRKVTEQVRQIDIYPTILDLLDIDYPNLESKTMLSEEGIKSRKAYIRACGTTLKKKKNWIKAVRKDGKKYIKYPERNWGAELYNLEEDPRELKDIKSRETKKEMEEEIPEKMLKDQKEIEIKGKLEALGYK